MEYFWDTSPIQKDTLFYGFDNAGFQIKLKNNMYLDQ
jgi:hypothetical protein